MGHLSPDAAAKVRQAMSLLKERYGSVSALARALKRSQPAVSDNLNHGTISIETANRVAKLMGMSVSTLLGEANAPSEDTDHDRDAIRRVARMRGHQEATIVAVLETHYRRGIHPDILFAEMTVRDSRAEDKTRRAKKLKP